MINDVIDGEERLKQLFMMTRSPVIYKADHKLTPNNERDKFGISG